MQINGVKELKNTYVDSNIRLHTIDEDTDMTTLSVATFNTNIETYIEDNIPEYLDEKYQIIKDKINKP